MSCTINYMELNYVDMPNAYCHLLGVDMTSTSKHHLGLQNYILKDSSLRGITSRIFSRGQDLDINSQIKSLGWYGVRDRLMSYYLNFALNSDHAIKVNVDNIEDILEVEKSLRFSTVSGYSRVLLFLFYLKLDNLERSEHSLEAHPLFPDARIIRILKLTNKRTIQIDYLIILLHHLMEYLSERELTECIRNGFSYEALYLKLEEQQISELCENFINYSSSINDPTLFTDKRI